MSELVEEFRDVARFDVDDGGMSQTYRGRYVEYIHFAVLLAHIERLEAKVKRFEQAGIRWRKEQVEETFDQWIEDVLTHWISDEDAAWQAWMYVHEWKVFPMLKRIERLESAVRAVKDWDIENFKERGAFVVPQEIRQMIQAATHGEGE